MFCHPPQFPRLQSLEYHPPMFVLTSCYLHCNYYYISFTGSHWKSLFVLSSSICDVMDLYYLNLFPFLTKEKKYGILNIENICIPPDIILSIPMPRATGPPGAVRTTRLAKSDLGSRVTSGLMADTPWLFFHPGTMNHTHLMEKSFSQACACLGPQVGRLPHRRPLSEPSHCLSISKIWPLTSLHYWLIVSSGNHYIAKVNSTPYVTCNREHAKIGPGSWLSRFTLGHHICGCGVLAHRQIL